MKRSIEKLMKHPIKICGYYPKKVLEWKEVNGWYMHGNLFTETCREHDLDNLMIPKDRLRLLGTGWFSADEVYKIIDVKDSNKPFYVLLEELLKIQVEQSRLKESTYQQMKLVKNITQHQREFVF